MVSPKTARAVVVSRVQFGLPPSEILRRRTICKMAKGRVSKAGQRTEKPSMGAMAKML